MGMLEAVAARVAAGETVQFRPTGSSMLPLIRSRDLVVVTPVNRARVEVGDIVLAKVAGAVYLHLVSAVDHARARVQISNNRGRVNGWTNHSKIYGICTTVAGRLRPAIEGKPIETAATPAQQHRVLENWAQAAIGEVRSRVDPSDREAVVGHLAARGLGFMQCIVAVRQLFGIDLGEAKMLVHGAAAFSDDRESVSNSGRIFMVR